MALSNPSYSCARASSFLFLGSLLLACAGAPGTPTVPATKASAEAEVEPVRLALEPMPLRPMTHSEQQLERTLRTNVDALLATGERHTGNEWGLASATDLLAAQLEASGLTVVREGFVGPEGELAQNLVVNFPGSDLQREVVLLGARYDSAPGSPGADDNATGAAALLEIAKVHYGKPRRRTLRLVWFSDASRRTKPELMGAWHHFELASKPKREDEPSPVGTDLRVCVDVHGLGAFSDAVGSQTYPVGMPGGHPIAEFVEVRSLPQYMAQASAVTEGLGKVSSIPIKSVTALETEHDDVMTPFAAFAEHGCPAVLVHDTGLQRFAEFGKALDTAAHIDFGRFARAVDALSRATESWVNAPTLGGPLEPAHHEGVEGDVGAESQHSSDQPSQ